MALLSKSKVVALPGNHAGLMLDIPLLLQFIRAPRYVVSNVTAHGDPTASLTKRVFVDVVVSSEPDVESPSDSFPALSAQCVV